MPHGVGCHHIIPEPLVKKHHLQEWQTSEHHLSRKALPPYLLEVEVWNKNEIP